MKRFAIVAFFHEESSICLAKYMAKQGCHVDYYYVNIPSRKGKVPGFEFWRARVHYGLQKLDKSDIPEMTDYTKNLSIRFYLISYERNRINKLLRIDKFALWSACKYIKFKKYDAINIVGQIPYVELCHNYLRDQNIIHSYHEVGSHQNNVKSSPSVDVSIKDHSKVILHSQFVGSRYLSLSGVDKTRVKVIPFGKFETCKLYVHESQLEINLDLSKPTFLFYGFIKPYKGLDLLEKAVIELKNYSNNYNLIIAGNGEDPSLSFFSSQSNCSLINRFLNNDEMMYLIKVCDVIVLPYHTASQTGIIPTVALYGKPVIATAVGAFPESIIDGYNGLLVEPGNYVAFSESMKILIEDKNMLKKLTEGMQKFGDGDDFDWNNIAKRTIDFCLGK